MVGLASIESPHNTQEAGPWATVESDINRGRLIPRLSAPLTSHKDNSSCWEKFSTFRFISAPLSSLLEWLPWPFIKTSDFDISFFFRSHQNFSVPLQKLAHEWWMIWELQESGLFSLSWLNFSTIYQIRYKIIFYLICLYTSCYLGYTLQLLYTSSAWILYIKIMVHFKLFWYQIP